MLFNSLDFALFLPIVFALYWFVFQKSLKAQNALVFAASYVFYGWWDWRFLSLILFSTLIDFFVGVGLGKYQKDHQRKLLLWTSIIINLGFLGFFKYYNFFLDNFVQAFSFLGSPIKARGLDIVLPVGISFYTFQTMSYSLDVYYEKLEPTKDFIAFSAFVSFFPQLVAGPIERATNLLPQFYTKRSFDYAKAIDGCRQILWGLFKKIVIADNCAEYTNKIFENYQDYNGGTLLLGAVFFAFQIYADFSGYSDVAIGTSRLFGFNLMQNFAFPYFSRNIAEFWRRWHISLTSWLGEYLYFPIAFKLRKWKKSGIFISVFIVFVISGIWHGPAWHFIVWGCLHGLLFAPLIFQKTMNNPFSSTSETPATLKDIPQILFTFLLISLTAIYFRAETLTIANDYLISCMKINNWGILQVRPWYFFMVLVTFISIEWFGKHGKYALENISNHLNKPLRFIFYYSIVIAIFWLGANEQEFIYFQF